MFIKKTLLYLERSEEKRQKYLDEIKDIKVEDLVYIDESGIDHSIIKENCWVKKGQEIVGNRTGKRRIRTSIIAALNLDNINAPMRLQGCTTSAVFVVWTEQFLVPSLKPGQVVIMDNAAFHKSPKIKQLIENAGCSLVYLPPYSPDLNPIENYWAVLKTYIKKIMHKFDNFFDALDHALQNTKRHFQT